MRTKKIFDEWGIQVYETDNKDARGKEWHITDGTYGCSVGFKPEPDVDWLKEFLRNYRIENMETMDSEIKELS